MLRRLRDRFNQQMYRRRLRRLEASLPLRLSEELAALEQSIKVQRPRIIVVKQDVNEDLYCCEPGTCGAELIKSTLLRTGPVALFTELGADFRIVETVDDPECRIWQERATQLKWDTLEFFSSYRTRVPGRDYGQNRFSVSPDSIDWNQYDIVISIDVCVPERITRNYPDTLWCYYVREVKAPSYHSSMVAPAMGQDIVLNHYFRLDPIAAPAHVLEFPYHVQRPGCFHQVFGIPFPKPAEREGVFVDHHTMVTLDGAQRSALSQFGPIASTIHAGDREVIPTSERLARRTMDDDLCERLLNSRYLLITPGKRAVFGTAMVESIAAGCLAIGDPESLRQHGFFFTKQTAAENANQAIVRMQYLDANPLLYAEEVARQQRLLEYLCYVRPVGRLLEAWRRKVAA